MNTSHDAELSENTIWEDFALLADSLIYDMDCLEVGLASDSYARQPQRGREVPY